MKTRHSPRQQLCFTILIIFSLITLCFFHYQVLAAVMANYAPPPPPKNIVDVIYLVDGTEVTLKGFIAKKVSRNKYLFRDHTGTIHIKISDWQWRGLRVSDKEPITVYGEVDKEKNGMTVTVKNILTE